MWQQGDIRTLGRNAEHKLHCSISERRNAVVAMAVVSAALTAAAGGLFHAKQSQQEHNRSKN